MRIVVWRWWLSALLVLVLLGAHGCGDEGKKPPSGGTSAEGGSSGDNNRGGSAGAAGGGQSTNEAGSGGDAGRASSNEGPEAFLPLYENGERLRAISLGEAGSQARRLLTWYDSELETECRFRRAEDGEMRCLPLVQSLTPGFLDPECSSPLFYDGKVEPCAEVPRFRAEAMDLDGCTGTRIIRMEPINASEVYHEQCSEEPEVLPETASVWQDADRLAPESLVRATERVRLNDDGVGVREWIGADGSREVIGMVDGNHGACHARELAPGGWRCLPTYAYTTGPWWFADAECSAEPLAYAALPLACAPPPKLVLKVDTASMGLPQALSLGEPVNGTVYEQVPGTDECMAREASEADWMLYTVAGDFDVSSLLALTEVTHGGGRFRTFHHAVDGVALTMVPGWNGQPTFFDSEQDAQCVAMRHGNGWRCLPEEHYAAGQIFYADANCEELVLRIEEDDRPTAAIIERNRCVREGSAEEIAELFDVGAAYTGPLYTDAGGSCVPADQSADTAFYRAERSTSSYPLLSEVLE